MKKRIVAIDILRGFALLGILLMNMSSFTMPSEAYYNPNVYGGDDFWNRLVFNLSHIFADQKMMALFSMLFGASVVLVTSNMEKRGQSPFWFHYKRNFWLLMFGLAHSIFLWYGDILVVYAVCAFILYWLRKLSPKWQIGLGLLLFFVPSLLNIWINTVLPSLPTADIQYYNTDWHPTEADIATQITYYQDGSYTEQLLGRLSLGETSPSPSTYTDGQALLDLSQLTEFFLRAFGMMLLGMAFYSQGVLTAQKSDEFYKKMAWLGFGVGIPTAVLSLILYTTQNWDASYSLFVGRIPNHVATPFVASGYVALIMLWSRSERWSQLQDYLAATGRMALTNYIGQSLIGTAIFYGFGLGLFGMASRVQQLGIIVLIWVVQLLFSKWWLSHFQYGPLEWIWRLLSHGRFQFAISRGKGSTAFLPSNQSKKWLKSPSSANRCGTIVSK